MNFNLIVFSRDRSCQLDLFLRSCLKHYKGDGSVLNIVYTSSDYFFQSGYDKLLDKYKNNNLIKFIKQTDFKTNVVNLVSLKNYYTQFFCDDDIFIRDFNILDNEFIEFENNERVLCLAPRLGKNISYCYTENKKVQPPKELFKNNVFEWQGLLGDFSYPMSVDGSVFRTKDIFNLITELDYRSPNTFEGKLAQNYVKNKPYMICYNESLLFNVPANKVQIDCNNRCGDITSKSLNEKWLNNYIISLEPLEKILPIAPHQEVDFTYELNG